MTVACRNGHTTGRYPSGKCRECHRINMARYRGPSKRPPGRYGKRTKESEVRRNRDYRQTLRGRADLLVRSAKRNARACGVPFAIAVDDVLPLLAEALWEGLVTLQSNQHNTASLDRKKPAAGYVYGNVQVIPWWLNAAYNRFPKDVVNEAIINMAARLMEGNE